jgi:hypothetical protein
MLDLKTIEALAQSLDYGFGKTADQTYGNTPTAQTSTVRGKLAGDECTITYTTIFTYDKSNPSAMTFQMRYLKDEANNIITEYVKNVRKEFRAKTGTALKLKETSRVDDVEMTSYNPMNTKATAYFRYFVKYVVG